MPDWLSFWTGWMAGCMVLNTINALRDQQRIREHNRQVREERQAGGANRPV